jgi:hypothetical protein
VQACMEVSVFPAPRHTLGPVCCAAVWHYATPGCITDTTLCHTGNGYLLPPFPVAAGSCSCLLSCCPPAVRCVRCVPTKTPSQWSISEQQRGMQSTRPGKGPAARSVYTNVARQLSMMSHSWVHGCFFKCEPGQPLAVCERAAVALEFWAPCAVHGGCHVLCTCQARDSTHTNVSCLFHAATF